MIRIIYNENDGYFYIKEGEHVYNMQFVSAKEAEEWIWETYNNY